MPIPVCYIVDKRIDGYIAKKFGWEEPAVEEGKKSIRGKGMSPRKIASLRQLYDSQANENGTDLLLPMDNPTEEELDVAFEKLKNFRTQIRDNNRKEIAQGIKHMDRCYDTLRHAYSLDERRSRINLLSSMFSDEVDRLAKGKNVDRQSVVNGFKDVLGNTYGGEFSILEGVYNTLLEWRQDAYDAYRNPQVSYDNATHFKILNDRNEVVAVINKLDYIGAPKNAQEYAELLERRYKEYTKMLENWTQLIPFVLKDLTKKEGVKLGIKKEYESVASSDSFGDNDIADKWDISEAVRDGWQHNNDLQSAFGSVGQQVRRLLSTIPAMEQDLEYDIITNPDGTTRRQIKGIKVVPIKDDLGHPVFMDPIRAHQELQEFLKGVQNSEDLIHRMSREDDPSKAKIPWMQPILELIQSNNIARTQFFCDFKKNFQPYSVMWEDENESYGYVRKIKTKILNKAKNYLIGKYNMVLSSRGKFPANTKMWMWKPVFNEETKEIDWERLAELRNTVLKWTKEDNSGRVGIFDKLDQEYALEPAPLISNAKLVTIKLNGKTYEVTEGMKREFLMEVFSSLGIDATVDAIDSILHSNDIYELRNQLLQLFDSKGKTGIMYVLTDAEGIKEPSLFRSLSASNVSKQDKADALKQLQDAHITFPSLYNRKSKENDPKTGKKYKPVREHTEKILDILSKHQEGYRVESRARYQGNTMYSFVAPSYLGDKLETIRSYVEADNKQGLLEFLQEEYLNSTFFVDDLYLATDGAEGHILNSWLADIVAACKNKNVHLIDSVAAIFSYERDLGREDKKFEDFTEREHGVDMLVHFFADEQQKKGYGGKGSRNIHKKLSAMYPVFILGDAGVSKYIRAPRITSPVRVDKNGNLLSEVDKDKTDHIEYRFDDKAHRDLVPSAKDEILDRFWDIYLQEKRRMDIDEAINLQMYANGKAVKRVKGRFSILTFLNPDSQEYNEKYAIPRDDEDNLIEDKDTIKAIIRQYLEDASLNGMKHVVDGRTIEIPSFKQRLQTLGVLDTDPSGTTYRYISTIANPTNIDDKISEFYWNTKLATAQQLQLMTIDPSFYHGTKDLQKRYKEIHAPGNVLDVMARTFTGELYCPERTVMRNGVEHTIAAGTETMAYFDDISLNAETFNPEFMEMAFRAFAKPPKDASPQKREDFQKRFNKALEDKIWIPKSDKLEETERVDTIKELLGSNYKIYDSYTANTLTDGQGYRTLTSYRRVKGMAGQWSEAMEAAYNEIMDIRRRHTVYANDGVTPIDYTELTEEEMRRIASRMLVLQPIKPYMFTHEKYPVEREVTGPDGVKKTITTYSYIPVQHKYAESLIIPELMPKGSKLRDLAFWMDENEVDMVGSTKIAKVGCFGQTDFQYQTNDNGEYIDSNGNVIPKGKGNDNFKDLAVPLANDKESFVNALNKAFIHELPYKDYRIQTNVPEHINASQLFGTQVRKLIMAGINMKGTTDYSSYLEGIANFDGTVNLSTADGKGQKAKLDGRNLLALYNSLICANILDSYSKFADNTKDIEKLSELLQQSTVGSMRESMDNLFAYVVTGSEEHLKRFMMPLFEGGLEHDAAALILSTFKKIVNKQQISGGSAVQVSAFGINGYDEDGDLRFVSDPDNPGNILYAEIEMPFDKSFLLETRNADGTITKRKVDIPFEKYCNREGTLIPTGKVIPKTIKVNGEEKTNPEWKKYQSYTYKEVDGKWVPCKYGDPGAKVLKPLIEQEYPDILSILAYRIPTERDYSMINCRIKRFTSKMAGGTLKVPPQGTTIAGFDFDIDKLYFMQREYYKHFRPEAYVEKNYSDVTKGEIWLKFYEENENIKRALEEARADAENENPSDLIELQPKKRRGKVVPGEFTVKHLTRLNSYWKVAKIEERFGKTKRDAFAETAIAKEIRPDKIEVKGEPYDYLEEYDFNLPPEENSRSSINNLLISIIQARLMDPQTVQQRYTPGGFANASDAARLMRELFHGNLDNLLNSDGTINDTEFAKRLKDKDADPEPDYDPTDPYTILIYNQQNQVAGKLIGIFANQNTNHAFASSMDVFELRDPISFCGHKFSDLLHKNNLEEAAEIDLNMAEFLAASVDAVKDPVLNFLNLNTVTADAGALLARLGYNTREIGLLFNQPVIRKLCDEARNKGVRARTIIDNLRKELTGSLTGRDVNNLPELTESDLALGIVNERKMHEEGKTTEDFLAKNARIQLAALELFRNILDASEDVSDFVTNTKFTASNAVSSTFGGMYAQQLRVDRYIERYTDGEDKVERGTKLCKVTVAEISEAAGLFSKPVDNDSKYLTMSPGQYLREIRYNPFAFEQAMYDTNRQAIKLLCGGWVDKKNVKHLGYFPYETETYKGIRKRMSELARYGTLSEDDINSIHSNIPVAMLAKQTGSLFDGEDVYVKNGEETNRTNREYYREKFAYDLVDMVASDPDGLGKLAIFKYLYPVSEEIVVGVDPDSGEEITKEVWKISMQDIGGMSADVKEEIRESWAYLMEVDDDGVFSSREYAQLGRDLFMYCFYQLGFDFSPLSFMHLAPIAVKDNIIVRRANSLPIPSWDEEGIRPSTKENPSDDVLVWTEDVAGSTELAKDKFGARLGNMEELCGNSYQLPSGQLTQNSVSDLIQMARSHPELKFKIKKDLTQEEFNLFDRNQVGEDMPSNIYFSAATLDPNNVTDESKENLHYGIYRSYREFLNEILEGTESSLNYDEFAQMWILNNLDNSRFVLDPKIGNERLKEILFGRSEKDGKKYKKVAKGILDMPGNRKPNEELTDVLTIDISAFADNQEDRDALGNIVSLKKNQKGEIMEAAWCPVIKLENSFYMATSNTDFGFNVNQSYVMTYVKVEPWGCTKSISYGKDQKLSPRLRYQSSMNAVPHRNEKYVEPESSYNAPEELPYDGSGRPADSEAPDLRDVSIINSAIDALIEEVKDNPNAENINWDGIREGLRNSKEKYRFTGFTEAAGVFSDNDAHELWKDITEESRLAIAQAVADYNNSKIEIKENPPTSTPEPLTEGSNSLGLPSSIREFLEDSVFDAYYQAYLKYNFLVPEDTATIEAMRQRLKKSSDKQIQDEIEKIKKACREDGVIMLNSKGDPVTGC